MEKAISNRPSQLTPWKKPTDSQWQKVIAKAAEVPAKFAGAVIDGYHQPIKDLDRPVGQVMAELGKVALTYGARANVDPKIIKEAAINVVENYSHLGLHEISIAYRQWANGELNVTGAEMYGGEWNATQVGKILSGYCERRKKVLGAYLKERAEEKERQEREERERKAQALFDQQFPAMIARAKKEMTDWKQVPYHWYEAAYRRGLLKLTDEELAQIGRLAMELMKKEQAEEKKQLNIMEVLKGEPVADPYQRAEVIARKIVVFEKLIKPQK